MRSLWVKIGLGATGVFVVGMMAVTLVRNAKAAAVSAFHDVTSRAGRAAVTAAATPVEGEQGQRLAALTGLESVGGWTDQAVEIPFRLEGVELGLMSSGVIKRTRANALPVMSLEVQLHDADARAALDECVLVPERHRDSDFGGGFRCATFRDADLVTFGTVRFAPGGFTRPLMLTSRQASEMQRGEPFEARASLAGGVKVEASGNRGELVRVDAGEHGANIRINDEHGNDIFRLLADSLGASLRVKDKNGRDIVRLSAGDGRLSLSIDTTGH
jgi:hypothetical protein